MRALVCSAIIRLGEEGRQAGDVLVDAIDLETTDPTVLTALQMVDEARRRRLIERQLANTHLSYHAASYLFTVADPVFWKRGISSISRGGVGTGDEIASGLGQLPLSALVLIVGAKAKGKKACYDALDRAALLCVTRALERGETVGDDALACIRFDLGGRYDWERVMPVVERAVKALPRGQAENVLVSALDSTQPKIFARAFKCIGNHPSQAVLECAMNGLLDAEATFSKTDEPELESGLRDLPNARAWLKWFVANGGGSQLSRVLESVAGGPHALATLKTELTTEGVQAAETLDDVDKVVALAQRVVAERPNDKTVPIYALRKLDTPPAQPTLNRIGGLPPGIAAERWPTHADEPMVHLFTLDLDAMPELKSQCDGRRSLSVFCWSPELNEAFAPGSRQTAVCFSTDDQVITACHAPKEANVRRSKPFEAIRIEVPSRVFRSHTGSLSELREAIYCLSGRVLGDPIWLQDNESGWRFIMQFDEGFADVNLGDAGVMYVFENDAFFQCH